MYEIGMIIIAFISGSIMYSYLLPKWILKKDIRKGTGDENPGGYNAYLAHKKLGLFCILLDMLKGFIPMFFFVKKIGLNTPWIFPMLLAPVMGHAFTPFFKGKGGKALSTAAGTIVGLLPRSLMGLLLLFLALFFSVVLVIQPFESRVLIIMVVFNLIIMILHMSTLWVSLGTWGITGILWYKQVEKQLPDHEALSMRAVWKRGA